MTGLTGWVALVLLIASFYLASRIPFLNSLFDGLKPQLRWHHAIAIASIVAMLFHLGQLSWVYKAHLPLLFNWRDLIFFSGWVSFIGVILPLPLAFLRVQIPYRKWRGIHLLTSISLISALIHLFLTLEPKNYQEWTIVFVMIVLGLLSILLSVILPATPFWGDEYYITKISEPRSNLFLIKLQAPDKRTAKNVHFTAGQFIYLKFVTAGFSKVWHPFTLISKPSEPHLELFIKARGRDTNQLKTISLPTPVRILAPFGTSFWKKDEPQLWIAYGIGVAIFLAAIRSFPDSYREKIHFMCCDSSKNNFFFSDELNAAMKTHPHFTWESYIGTGQEFIAQFKGRVFESQSVEKVRICGHPGFQNSLKSMLMARGIGRHMIELEGLL